MMESGLIYTRSFFVNHDNGHTTCANEEGSIDKNLDKNNGMNNKISGDHDFNKWR